MNVILWKRGPLPWDKIDLPIPMHNEVERRSHPMIHKAFRDLGYANDFDLVSLDDEHAKFVLMDQLKVCLSPQDTEFLVWTQAQQFLSTEATKVGLEIDPQLAVLLGLPFLSKLLSTPEVSAVIKSLRNLLALPAYAGLLADMEVAPLIARLCNPEVASQLSSPQAQLLFTSEVADLISQPLLLAILTRVSRLHEGLVAPAVPLAPVAPAQAQHEPSSSPLLKNAQIALDPEPIPRPNGATSPRVGMPTVSASPARFDAAKTLASMVGQVDVELLSMASSSVQRANGPTGQAEARRSANIAEAAIAVLKEAGIVMHEKEILGIMKHRHLHELNSNTPLNSLSAALSPYKEGPLIEKVHPRCWLYVGGDQPALSEEVIWSQTEEAMTRGALLNEFGVPKPPGYDHPRPHLASVPKRTRRDSESDYKPPY